MLDFHKIINTEEKRRGVEALGQELIGKLSYCERWIVAFANILFENLGTDSLNLRDEYGQALNAELQNFAQAGIPPLEVLRIATEHSAAMVGAGNLLGSLQPGKLADIVLLDGNPLDNIANTLTVWKVVLGGRVFEERQPLTANGGEDVSDPDDLHSHH